MEQQKPPIPMYREEKRLYDLEKIENAMEEHHGIIQTGEILSLGVDYRRVLSFVKDGSLRKIRNGYFTTGKEGKYTEEELVLGLFPDGVFTMETALYYYGYLTKESEVWRIAIDKNTSKTRFHLYYPAVEPYYTEPEVLKLGVNRISHGNLEITLYSRERLMADVLKYQKKMDPGDFREAIRGYLSDEKKDPAMLLEMADQRKVREKARNMIGVWM